MPGVAKKVNCVRIPLAKIQGDGKKEREDRGASWMSPY